MPSETPTSIPSVDQLQEWYDAHYASCEEIVKTHNALLDLDETRRVAVREGAGAALAYMNRALDSRSETRFILPGDNLRAPAVQRANLQAAVLGIAMDEAPQANRQATAVLLAAPLILGATVVGAAAVAPLAVMGGAYYWLTRGRSSSQKQQQ